MPKFTVKRGNLAEHDSYNRHQLAHGMGLYDFSYTYAVLTLPTNQVIDGVKEFLNFPVVPVGFPLDDNQVSNKFYVDYASQAAVTFENLFSNGDVGTGANQVAKGDHSHENLPTDDQKDALDTSQDPDAANPFVTYNQFSDHHNRHENNGPDEIDLSGLSGGPITINGMIVTVTNVSTTPYTLLNTDVHVSVDTSILAIILNLPAITSINHGQQFIIKDGVGNAGDKNVSVTPNGVDEIGEGGAGTPFIIFSDNDSIGLIANNTTKNWELAPVDKGKFKIIEVDSITTLTYTPADEIIIVCDTDSGGFTVNLPALSDVKGNIVYSILNKGVNSNDVVVDGSGGETIDGEITQEVPDASSIRIIPTSTGWYIL